MLRNYKKGVLQDNKHLAGADDYDLLSRFVREKTQEIGNAIFSGEIPVSPYRNGSKEDACRYCPYAAVCGFDEGIRGYQVRRGKAFKDKGEIWQYLAERRKKDGSEVDTAAEGSH